MVLEQVSSSTQFQQNSDINKQQQQQHMLGHLDGIVSTPGAKNTKWRASDANSKRFAAILLETNVVELQRHLLTLTVQNQVSHIKLAVFYRLCQLYFSDLKVLMQKLEQSNKSRTLLNKRLEKNKDHVDDLRFQVGIKKKKTKTSRKMK